MLKYGVTHRLSIAYHPQTSGQVEESNHGLKRILERTIAVAGDHRKVQLNELNELRDHAYENSLIYKEKTKRIHGSKIKNSVFNIGDQVLLFNSRLKIFSGKLKTHWTRPFTIAKVFPYGTVELSQAKGPNFKVNGHRVKHYFGGDVPQLDYPDCEVFHALSFVLHSQELHILSFILGIQKSSQSKVKGTDVVVYSQRFQELALMCDQMFPEEIDKVEKYVDGLPDTIHGSVMATKPKTMQDAIEFATELVNKKINTWAERQADNKRKSDDTTRNNHQQPNKRQKTGRAYAVGNGERKESPAATNNHRNPTCYECGNQEHYRSDCPELKNQDHGNQARGTRAHGMVHALEGGETNQDLNDVEDDINS
nr:reverse transcriptase domain-containing protein [Tanacetum cinerariifolium]